jgi:hypothetical protein
MGQTQVPHFGMYLALVTILRACFGLQVQQEGISKVLGMLVFKGGGIAWEKA